jgi:hypothetical protein
MEEKWNRFKSLKHYIKCKRAAKKAQEQAFILSCGGDCYGALLAQRMSNDCDKLAKQWKHMVIFGK